MVEIEVLNSEERNWSRGMTNVEEELLRYPLHMLKWVGQNPEESKTKFFMVVALNTFFGTIIILLNFLQLIYANGNIVIIVQNFEGIGGVAQVVAKCVITAIKLEDFRQLLKYSKQFWNIERSVGDAQIILNAFVQTLRLEKIFLRVNITASVLFFVTSYFKKQLPAGVWTMKDQDTLYVCAFILQLYFFPWGAVYTMSYDGLFLSLCTHLRIQFKMLHDSFEDFKVSNIFSKSDEKCSFDKLISYVHHHEFLLRFLKNLRDTYSPVMLIVYISLLMIYFAEMYVIMESRNIFLLVRHSIAMAAVLLQLAFYCIPLNYVTDEALYVSQGIYNSDWHSKYSSNLRSAVPFIIQRSQKEIIFKAGGLIEINCTTLISVIRLSYSVCTIMRALKNV